MIASVRLQAGTEKLGWEVNLNAMPGDCDLEQLARNYNVSLSQFQFVSSYFKRRRQSKEKADLFVRGNESFGVCLEEMIAKNPGIEYRFCKLDRRADWLQWMLQRSSSPEDSFFARISIEGESVVAPAAKSTQGFPLKWNNPETCMFISEWLNGIAERRLYRSYDPEAMLQAGLYKWQIPEDRLKTYETILQDFRDFRDFYESVSKRSEAALVVVD